MKPEMDSTNREMSQKVLLYFAVHHASRMKIKCSRESGGAIKRYEQNASERRGAIMLRLAITIFLFFYNAK